MGANVRMDSLWDLAARKGSLEVRCHGCRHIGWLDAGALAMLFAARSWNADLSLVAMRLRCSRCGKRAPECRRSWQEGVRVKVGR